MSNYHVLEINKTEASSKLRSLMLQGLSSTYVPFKVPAPSSIRSKGQLILKCPFGVFKSPKKTKKFLSEFLPKPLKNNLLSGIKCPYFF